MKDEDIINLLRQKLEKADNRANIKLLKGGRSFKATISDSGILVDNLAKEPLLPWVVFIETVNLLKQKGGIAVKGNAMNYRLGEGDLPIDSIEGHVASVVYNKKIGDSVFRRITPIACILV